MLSIDDQLKLDLKFKSLESRNENTFSDNFDEERPSVRWAPLGATASPEPSEDKNILVGEHESEEKEKLIAKLEDEQEKLTTSLTLLTSHFAQVQLRLKQIADDKCSNIDEKLQELEEFANKGLPDVWTTENLKETVSSGKQEQIRIINDLKRKLEELESFAYQSGDINELPTSKVLANQKFIMEQLRSQLDINFDNFVTLNDNELKNSVDNAINDIISPVKVREKLVEQLKTQILDLERFIQYLQDDELLFERKSSLTQDSNSDPKEKERRYRSKKAHEGATQLIRKALNLLQLIAASQFGCQMKDSKRVIRANLPNSEFKNERMHWGDIRAGLEVAIEKIIELSTQLGNKDIFQSSSEDLAFLETDYDSDDEKIGNHEAKKRMLYAIRKEFCPLLMKLIQHGLYERSQSSAVRRVSCFSGRNMTSDKIETDYAKHPWDLVTYFYDMKNGREIINSPACKLSESFYLANVGGKSITSKEKLLKAIGIILDSHSAFKRSKDAHFKAFVCFALNEKCLADWLKMILKNRIILYSFYENWSYAHKMGFDDTLHSLRRLTNIDFDLAYDLSVRQLSKIKDAF